MQQHSQECRRPPVQQLKATQMSWWCKGHSQLIVKVSAYLCTHSAVVRACIVDLPGLHWVSELGVGASRGQCEAWQQRLDPALVRWVACVCGHCGRLYLHSAAAALDMLTAHATCQIVASRQSVGGHCGGLHLRRAAAALRWTCSLHMPSARLCSGRRGRCRHCWPHPLALAALPCVLPAKTRSGRCSAG